MYLIETLPISSNIRSSRVIVLLVWSSDIKKLENQLDRIIKANTNRFLESWLSGRKRRSWKPLTGNRPGVRIPRSPPYSFEWVHVYKWPIQKNIGASEVMVLTLGSKKSSGTIFHDRREPEGRVSRMRRVIPRSPPCSKMWTLACSTILIVEGIFDAIMTNHDNCAPQTDMRL